MKHLILGTDWWSDCDDAVAIRLLARAAKAGEIDLCGICINACMDDSVASLTAMLRAEGMGDIPLALDRTAVGFAGVPRYQPRLAAAVPDVTNADAEDPVRFYRRLLAAANEAGEQVELLEIGFLQATVAALHSAPDDISPLSGEDLFRQSVAHVWAMAGKWDEDGACEHNVALNDTVRVAGHEFCRDCPVPVTFLGWEVGHSVLTGGGLAAGDPLHNVMCDYGAPDGRSSWDPMTALLAVTDDLAAAGYTAVTGRATVDAADGANHFAPDPAGPHRYVVKTKPDEWYQKAINDRVASV